MTDQSMDTNKVQLREPLGFIGFIYRSKGEGSLTEAKMTQRYLHHQSQHPHGGQLTKAENLKHTAGLKAAL